MSAADDPVPFPDSLCHRCSAPRYVKTPRSLFVLCARVAEKYPRQPVRECKLFTPRGQSDEEQS